ncbi:MAG: hypothetical protein ACI9JM_002723 [Halioglobus sp.]|jgi:hypothetical protein
MKPFLIIALTTFLIACSNKQIYTAVQENQRAECAKLARQQDQGCMRELETSYKDYEKDRQDLLNDKPRSQESSLELLS